MKKLKKFELNQSRFLSSDEMTKLHGGEQSFTCRTNEPCSLFISSLGITVQGTCQYQSSGTTVSCYCKNGDYSTSSSSTTSCWK